MKKMLKFLMGTVGLLSMLFFYSCQPTIKEGDVQLMLDPDSLFVGAYAKVKFKFAPGFGLDDVDVALTNQPESGSISLSRDQEFDPANPDVMLIAGYAPGTYSFLVFAKGTTDTVATINYKVTSTWVNEISGPPLAFTEVVKHQTAGSAWGGGPAGLQNVNVIPATGTRRIAIVLVDTESQRYTTTATDLQAIRDQWMNELINGVATGGVTQSARQYYREASYNTFDIAADVFGPVQLTGDWETSYSLNDDGLWIPMAGFWQAAITAADGLVNFSNYQSIVLVSQTVAATATDPQKFAWPYASIGSWGPYVTAEGNFNLGVMSMPFNWDVVDGRRIRATFSHELGHNLGMGDQYAPSVPMPGPPPDSRNVGGWDMMHAEGNLPHFSIAHRMQLGWVNPTWMQAFNFSSMATPVDQTVTLSAIESGAPPAGRRAGIEVRLADGWNYYIEYRRRQTGQIGDQNLPTDNRILGTDMVSAPYAPPIARPSILLLTNDSDGDGSVLNNGNNYRETDFTDPVYPTDFSIDVSGIDGTKADVRIRYGVNSNPDPSIRPWPASADRPYQSPDIEVQNARNLADPAWFNVPWVGNVNTVIATVKNNGNLDAPNVRVNFSVKDFTVSSAPETPIGSAMQNIPALGTATFTASWTPPATGHYCIIVRIPLYQTPGAGSVVEMTELNNLAQSNYDRFISGEASPASREMSFLNVCNPYSDSTRIFITAGQTNPNYRTYLEHRWLKLAPRESKKVKVMFEFDPTAPIKQDVQSREKFRKVPNDVKLAAHIEDPKMRPIHSADMTGGAQVQIVTGRKTKMERFSVEKNNIRGTVVTVDNGDEVPGGKVILRIDTDGKPENMTYQTVTMNGGDFAATLKENWRVVSAYYVPIEGYSDCESKPVQNK